MTAAPSLEFIEGSSDTTILDSFFDDVEKFSKLKKVSNEEALELILNSLYDLQNFVDTSKRVIGNTSNMKRREALKYAYNELNFFGSWITKMLSYYEEKLLKNQIDKLKTTFNSGTYSLKTILDEEYTLLAYIYKSFIIVKEYKIGGFPYEAQAGDVFNKLVDAIDALDKWVEVERYLLGKTSLKIENETKKVTEGKKSFFSKLFGL